MLGEGLTAGAPVQQMKFDESAFDRPAHRGRRVSLLLGLAAALAVVLVVVL